MSNIKNFEGFACKYEQTLPDGRIISKDAFSKSAGMRAPLKSMSKKFGEEEIIGSALIENKPEGVYAKCTMYNEINEKLLKVIELALYTDSLVIVDNHIIAGRIISVNLVLKQI